MAFQLPSYCISGRLLRLYIFGDWIDVFLLCWEGSVRPNARSVGDVGADDEVDAEEDPWLLVYFNRDRTRTVCGCCWCCGCGWCCITEGATFWESSACPYWLISINPNSSSIKSIRPKCPHPPSLPNPFTFILSVSYHHPNSLSDNPVSIGVPILPDSTFVYLTQTLKVWNNWL